MVFCIIPGVFWAVLYGTIKTILREKNLRTHVTSEMITSDATANAESEVNIPTAPIPSTHVSNNSSNDSSRNSSKNSLISSYTLIFRTNPNK